MNSVYVGNLHTDVTAKLLHELCVQVAPVKSVHLPKDRVLQTHMGYGFVEFESSRDQEYAMKVLQGTRLFDQTLKLNKVNNEEHALFVRNLDSLVDRETLYSIFSKFGELVDVKLGTGTATVLFKDEQTLQKALEVDGTNIMSARVVVERKR